MEALSQWRDWLDAHRAEALDLVRFFIGIALFVRGLSFLTNSEAYLALMPEGGPDFLVAGTILHYVALAHLCGGLFLSLGLLTRLAALVQVPVLIGAVFHVHGSLGPFEGDQSFELAALVLFLLVVFSIWGSGPWSLDTSIARRAKTQRENEQAIMEATVERLHGTAAGEE